MYFGEAAMNNNNIKNIKSLIKKYIDYYNSDKAKSDPVVLKAKKKFNKFYEEVKKYNKEYVDEITNNGKFGKLKYEILEEKPDKLIISIFVNKDDITGYISAYDFINDIIKKLKKDIPNYQEFIEEIYSGDVDEGCLYIDFK